MYRRIINFLRGSISVRVESPCPERVLNLCAVHEIPFWDLKWRDERTFTMRTTRRGSAALRAVTGETDCTLCASPERGAPAIARRFRTRYVLLAAAGIFLLAFLCSNLYIWEFRLSGNKTVPSEKILRALEDYGITVGSRSMDIDQEDMRNHVLLELPDVSWLAVNVKGCVAHVQVVERLRPPRAVRENEITNVVARRSGIITKVEALDGEAQTAPGSTVTEGQLLISGVTDVGGVRLHHGMGRVWARTWHEIPVLVPLTVLERQETGRSVRTAVDFGKHRINLYGKGSMSGADCDKIVHTRAWTLPGGFRLPVKWVREIRICCETVPCQRKVAAAQQEGEETARQLLAQELPPESSIVSTRFSTARRSGWLLVTLQAECLEEIGRQVILPAADPS